MVNDEWFDKQDFCRLVGVQKGLLCIKYEKDGVKSIFICNPLTKQMHIIDIPLEKEDTCISNPIIFLINFVYVWIMWNYVNFSYYIFQIKWRYVSVTLNRSRHIIFLSYIYPEMNIIFELLYMIPSLPLELIYLSFPVSQISGLQIGVFKTELDGLVQLSIWISN